MAAGGRTDIVIGNGSTEQLSPGVWSFRFSLGKDPVTGKYQYSARRTIHTRSKRELRKAMDEYKRELNEMGVDARPRRATVASYLDEYHRFRRDALKPLAYEREGDLVREAGELLGKTTLSELTPAILRRVYLNARETGRFTDSEVFMIHGFVKRALNQAVEDEVLSKNPAKSVKVPRPDYKQREALTLEEASRLRSLLLELDQAPCVVMTMLLLETGCRRGEVMGLTWKNVWLGRSRINVCQQLTSDGRITTPKSKMSNRRIALAPSTLEYLETWKEAQRREFEARGLEQTEDTFVCHSYSVRKVEVEGQVVKVPIAWHLDSHNFDRWFRNFCVLNGFGRYTKDFEEHIYGGRHVVRGEGYVGLCPHALRHTHATLLIGNGADWKTVQARMGHQDPSFTVRQYAHVIEANDDAAAELFDGLLERSDN